MKYILLISLFFSAQAWCQYDIEKQEDDKKSSKIDFYELKQRIYVGGEFGLSFGYGFGYVLAAPLIGYDITERFSAGISTTYQLYRFSNNLGNGININTFGVGTFARFRPINPLIIQAEFDLYNTVNPYGYGLKDRVNVPAFLSGIGYAGGGDRSYYHIMLMYDFIGNPNMPLPNIIFERLYLKMGLVFHLN